MIQFTILFISSSVSILMLLPSKEVNNALKASLAMITGRFFQCNHLSILRQQHARPFYALNALINLHLVVRDATATTIQF